MIWGNSLLPLNNAVIIYKPKCKQREQSLKALAEEPREVLRALGEKIQGKFIISKIDLSLGRSA